jgi:hypothetical protein
VTSALDGAEWPVLHLDDLPLWERVLNTLCIGEFDGPQSRFGRYGEEKILVPVGNRYADVTIRTELYRVYTYIMKVLYFIVLWGTLCYIYAMFMSAINRYLWLLF